MTNPSDAVQMHARAVVSYFEQDDRIDNPGEKILANRPALAALIGGLRDALERQDIDDHPAKLAPHMGVVIKLLSGRNGQAQ